jgi:hypothetical protein
MEAEAQAEAAEAVVDAAEEVVDAAMAMSDVSEDHRGRNDQSSLEVLREVLSENVSSSTVIWTIASQTQTHTHNASLHQHKTPDKRMR